MKAVLMCTRSKLRRKWVSSCLLGTCILIATALFVNALVLLRELNPAFDRAYEEMGGPQMCCLWSNEILSTDAVLQFLEGWQDEIAYQVTEHTKTIDYMEKDGVKLSNGILLELPEAVGGDLLSPKSRSGEAAEMPGPNQVWATTKMANILGLEEGDSITLQFAGQALTVDVAKIVIDPVFGSSGTNVYRMWCGFGQLSNFPLAENNAVSYLEVRYKEYSPQKEQAFIRDAEKQFHMPLGDAIYTYGRIKDGYMALYQMVGAGLCFVSVILAGTVVVLMLFLVRGDMEEDVRNMGIYKSLGMAGAQITGIYLGCYGAIGFVGASLGSLLGGKLSRAALTKILGEIGLYAVSFGDASACQLLGGALAMAAVTGTCFFAVFKIRKLNAATAIRTGSWQAKGRGQRESRAAYAHGKASFELYYAVRGMGNKKLRYGYLSAVCLILGCLTMVCLGSLDAVKEIDQEPEIWGFIKTDIYVTSQEDTPVSRIIEELGREPEVIYTYGVNKITSQYRPDNQESWKNIPTEVYELPWNDEIKDRSLYGRRPLGENEVGVGLALAQEYGLEVGDSLELIVNGEKGFYKVTGIFQTLSNYGMVMRMVTEDLDQFVKADGAYADYMLVLADGADKWEYAKELAARYGGKFSFIAAKSNGENITGILAPAVGAILAILFAVATLTAANLTFVLIQREQRVIGLLKAVGMTSWQIIRIYSWRNGLAAFAGSSLGAMLGWLVVPKLLAPYARLLGLSEFPFAGSLAGAAWSALLLPACVALSVYGMVKAISRAPVRQLVSE